MLNFGTDTPKLRLILSGFRGQLAPFITVHSPDSTKSGRCPYLAAKFAGPPRRGAESYAAESARFLRPIRANEGERERNQYKTASCPLSCRQVCGDTESKRPGRFGADALLKTFNSVLPCKRNFNTPFNSNFYDKHLYERARMKSAHGTAENIGCSITTNKDALQSAVARRLTGRGRGLSAIADFQTHAPKLPRQAGTALFECRR